MKTLVVSALVIATSLSGVIATGPGQSCRRNNKEGTCIDIYQCIEVIHGIQLNIPPPPNCYKESEDSNPFVCCLDSSTPTTQASRTTQESRRTTTSVPQVRERISKRKCREYAKEAYIKIPSPALQEGPPIQVDKCVKSAEELIVGGTNATLGEFPHMALLGYGDNPNLLSYSCGGSLISEHYVLTAAHCGSESLPSFVLLGDLILHDESDGARTQLIPVASDRGFIPHPDWDDASRYRYDDIALIRLARRAQFNPRVRPACLHLGKPFEQGKLIASGWGTVGFGDYQSDRLLKVNLNEIGHDICSRAYRSKSLTASEGIKDDQQICAGVLEGGKDTCQGDSGGPLQVYRSDPHCTYDIVGVVSFGKGCALKNTPGVYARVQYFVDWIESIVWPGLSRR